MSVPAGSYEAALELASEWHAAPDVDALAMSVLHGVLELIEADAAGWNEYDPETGRFLIKLIPEGPMLADQALLERYSEQNPLVGPIVADPLSPPITFSDFLSQEEFHRLEIYREFYGPHGVEYQVAFGVAADRIVGVALNRGDRDFSRAERELLEAIRRHIAVAYESVASRTAARARLEELELGLSGTGRGVVVLAEDGGIADATVLALVLLRDWFGGDAAALPPELAGVGRWPRTFTRVDARLVATRVEARSVCLVLEETRPRPNAAVVERYRLTQREVDVLAAAALGHTARETAELLWISPRTVEKHLEHARAKLGARTRTEAARLVFDP